MTVVDRGTNEMRIVFDLDKECALVNGGMKSLAVTDRRHTFIDIHLYPYFPILLLVYGKTGNLMVPRRRFERPT